MSHAADASSRKKLIPALPDGRILRPAESYLGFVLLMNDTPNLALPYILPAQAQKHVTHNEAIRAIDCLVHLSVTSRTLSVPPAMPDNGSRFIVAADASGGWTGHDGKVAAYQDGAWAFYGPKEGWRAWCAGEGALLVYQDGAWTELSNGGAGDLPDAFDNLTHVGINTTADVTNKLAIKSPASLFDNTGNGHQQKINKAAAADTASVLYQTNYSGRAEMGLAGDDDFHFKVSPDGSTWYEALKIDRNTGRVLFPISGGPREVLTANRSYYVRTDGSDSNNGLANTSGGAFLTIQKAVDTACALDLSIYNVTINVADGTYSGGIALKPYLGTGPITIVGNTSTPGNCLLKGTGSRISAESTFATYQMRGFETQTVTSGNSIALSGIGILQLNNWRFGACAGSHLRIDNGARLNCKSGSFTISGSASYFAIGGYSATIDFNSATITLDASVTFTATAYAQYMALVNFQQATFSLGAYSVTGQRYNASGLSLISSGGGGASFIPGSTAGATSSGGTYL